MALGGLASGFGMGPGVSPPAVAAGTVVGCGARPLVAGPPCGGWGGLVLGCVVDAGGLVRRPPRRARALVRVCVGVWVCVVRVGLLVPVG